MSIKKIVASAGIAAGALAAMASTASASPLPQVDPIKQISDLAGGAGVSTLHNTGGGVEMIHDGTSLVNG